MVSTDTNQAKVVALIGRWQPLHIGHKTFIEKLTKDFDKIVVIIGSCYSIGTVRNCIPAIEREKMIRAIFKTFDTKVNLEIAHLPDYDEFDDWVLALKRVCHKHGVTHFCTGNKEDILDVLEKKGETLGFEMINPEEFSEISIHATDIRKLIIEGRYEDLEPLIPNEVKPILFKYSFREIVDATKNRSIGFVEGRQSVDVVLLVRNISDNKIYVLLGKRSMEKEDFPGVLALPGGGIDEFESPIMAAIREFGEETGIKIKMLDNSLEPAIVRFENIPKTDIEQMAFLGIYSSEDENIAGSKGGSSQCFGIFIEDYISKLQEYLEPNSDLTDVGFYEVGEALNFGLAYQHSDMLKKAITMFEAYPDLRRNIYCKNESRKIELSISDISDSDLEAIFNVLSKLKK